MEPTLAPQSHNSLTTPFPAFAPVSLGILGCGGHALQSHLPALRSVGGEIQALCDRSTERLTEAAQLCEKKPFLSFEEEALLQAPVAAVLIATPDEFHAASLLTAVRAGKHVFIEKPLAINSSQLSLVRQALAIARAQGLVVSSCHPRRFDPPFVWLKEQLPGLFERHGRALSFEFDFSYHKPSAAWKHQRSLLLDHLNHEIDLVHFLFGHSPFTAHKLYDSALRYSAVGLRDDGLAFSFMGSRTLESRLFHEQLRLRLEHAELRLDMSTGRATLLDHEKGTTENFATSPTDYVIRFLKTNENFIRAVQGRAENYLTEKDLLVNTELGIRLVEGTTWQSR
jgi:predicted dehydrogenase